MKNNFIFLQDIYRSMPSQVTKRAWLLFLCILCFSSAQSQLRSELNLPRADDILFKQQVEYKNPGRSGENVLWDFSRMGNRSEDYELVYDTIGGLTVGIEHNTRYYYSLSGDSLLCHGYENATTLMTNERPELLLRFPVNYGDSTFCYYNGNGEYSNRLGVSAMGTVSSKVDAYGMMIIPGGDTLTNVLRVQTIKKIAYSSKPLFFQRENAVKTFVSNDSVGYRLAADTAVLELTTFRWYVEGYRYPVFETVRNTTHKNRKESEVFSTAFFYPPRDHYYLETDPENQKIAVLQNKDRDACNPLAETTFSTYPNPVSATLNVEIFLPVEAKIRIQVRSVANKNVYINESEGKLNPGSHYFRYDVTKLPPGYYLLNIWADNYLLSETILKQ